MTASERAARRRRATYLRGHGAERLALLALLLKGYRPVARRFAAAGGEIDLVVRRGGVVVFVEVKARPTLDAAAAAIDARKRRAFSRAARAWMVRHPWSTRLTLRADAVFVAPRRWPRHLVHAFDLDLS